ncbi:hypothetical protein [Bacillus thuringiensis]|uniref:hypothetical protein n=1 Tax=Bacillus thuringiensis TaxID=1428 RepID=UPI000A3697CF|nr:hypothetical protein [Bacillus thuringiensis]OUA54593.1 hypothetical protein BK781_24360 [Bacillus thuringiensis serovar aizawai]
MWKINISAAYRTYKFTDKFIKDILLWAYRNRGFSTHEEILKSQMSEQLRALVNYKKYGNKFKDSMLVLSQCRQIGSVLNSFNVYTKKYHLILRGKILPPKQLSDKTLGEIRDTFDYFYTAVLKSKYFWEIYNPGGTQKSKKQVREEQGKDRVCPYCDQIYLSADSKSNMDHFLPISQFPFLSIHWANLVVACSICNGILVKNKDWHIPVLHPYYDNIEKILYFSFDRKHNMVQVKTQICIPYVRKGKLRGGNFIDLLKLNKSYQGVWAEVEDERNSLDDQVQKSYQEFKDQLLTEKTSLEILKTAVGEREMYHKGKKRKKIFSKMKWDYGKEYMKMEGKEYIEFLRKEQKEMLAKTE